MEITELRILAGAFLHTADKLHEKVAAYLNGSNETEDEIAYNTV